jgi:hypothetical protein
MGVNFDLKKMECFCRNGPYSLIVKVAISILHDVVKNMSQVEGKAILHHFGTGGRDYFQQLPVFVFGQIAPDAFCGAGVDDVLIDNEADENGVITDLSHLFQDFLGEVEVGEFAGKVVFHRNPSNVT